ncbi:Sugar fermentation stimulation protein homolog (fragment) [anaerobic digester metagenome]|uniref:Sugar fermentation stimulation protein homolog n=1 Tax=anaerobic digester metagenome TaxID=1263854 RepID=A0A485M189_9ZZZZ
MEDDGVARFPDAPSKRGKKHLQELIRTLHDGFRAAVIFVVQRNDARVFSPNLVTDLLFAEALRLAASAGVEIYALGCSVSRQGIGLQNYLPVEL